ncbi:hypothetical protein M378DRAFT_18180 [Amanita muscaria Koide BX008]|uniref:Uncharacterized protein n=1 Tax=Amanita muscaria (strain Koide BX008) TaxID=946122 RepID=A0A0C2WGF4_AMAMK|nr:hypothetical protein M378DRAFT_18180 [Amanita muscaria Koide BX008]
MDVTWNPPGVHGNGGGSVKYCFIPKVKKIYPLNPKQQPVFDEWLREQLDKGYIVPSKSPQAAGFFFTIDT